jgi:hypothetical protein
MPLNLIFMMRVIHKGDSLGLNLNEAPPEPAILSSPNFRTLDLSLLRVFDEVMAERSLTRAARNLSLWRGYAEFSLVSGRKLRK